MTEDDFPPPDLGNGPFSLEMAEKWLSWLDDIATSERDVGYATRYVLLNLLRALHAAKLIDLDTFIPYLSAGIPELPGNAQWATRSLLDEIRGQPDATVLIPQGRSRLH